MWQIHAVHDAKGKRFTIRHGASSSVVYIIIILTSRGREGVREGGRWEGGREGGKEGGREGGWEGGKEGGWGGREGAREGWMEGGREGGEGGREGREGGGGCSINSVCFRFTLPKIT